MGFSLQFRVQAPRIPNICDCVTKSLVHDALGTIRCLETVPYDFTLLPSPPFPIQRSGGG